jgi:SAM-dependent methyltransferase
VSSDKIIDLYERHAHEWVSQRSRPRRFFEKAWLDQFCSLLPAEGTILDVGCGPGKPMAAYLLTHGFGVCGVDSSPSMVALARANFPGQEWLVADMRKLALNRRFDGIMAWDSFFHLNFDDQRRMFHIFRAHAKSGAPLLFTSGPTHGEAIGSFRGEPLYHASLSPEEYRTLFAQNGFEPVAETMEDPDCGWHSVWLARRLQQNSD